MPAFVSSHSKASMSLFLALLVLPLSSFAFSPTTLSTFSPLISSLSPLSSSIPPNLFSTFHPSTTTTTTSLFMRKGGGKPKGPFRTVEVRPTMNSEIKHPEVRVSIPPSTGVGKDEVLGVLPTASALKKAQEMKVDLILVSESGDIPVCKLVEYTKWRYMQEKKAKTLKKNSKSTEVKEIKMSYKIDVGDLKVRQKNCFKFLRAGNRVKLNVQFKGREQSHMDLGYDLLDRFMSAPELEEWGSMEGKPKKEGRGISVMVAVRQERIKREREEEKAKERKRKKEEKMRAETEGGGGGEDIKLVEEEEEEEIDVTKETGGEKDQVLNELF